MVHGSQLSVHGLKIQKNHKVFLFFPVNREQKDYSGR